jgi:hypothetical protein
MPKSLATATLDRLLHHAHVLATDGQDSYRLAQRPPPRGVKPLTSSRPACILAATAMALGDKKLRTAGPLSEDLTLPVLAPCRLIAGPRLAEGGSRSRSDLFTQRATGISVPASNSSTSTAGLGPSS